MGFDSPKARQILKKAGYVKGDIDVPFSNDGGYRITKRLMHINLAHQIKDYQIRNISRDPAPIRQVKIGILEHDKPSKITGNLHTKLYDLAKRNKDGEISSIRFNQETEAVFGLLIDKYMSIAEEKSHHILDRLYHLKEALGAMFINSSYTGKKVQKELMLVCQIADHMEGTA